MSISYRNSNIQALTDMTRIITGAPIQRFWSRKNLNTITKFNKTHYCHFYMDYEGLLLNESKGKHNTIYKMK